MRMICKQGGDTDTNACIAGGMVGALVGIKAIPINMVRKVIDYDCSNSKLHGG